MQNEALQVALVLYRAPTERFSLQRAELPHDIGLVLRLASAPQPLLHEVAAEVGEDEGTVLEAVRFYLQLVLFQPEASAYRVLGLPEDAPHRQIREHHRWLQRWLHPDRRGEDWETSFAPRVNWAWGHLHNESARRAYDRERVMQPADHAIELPERFSFRPGWMRVRTSRVRMSHLQRFALAALMFSCIVLLYVASTRQDTPPPDVPGGEAHPANAALSTMPQNEHVNELTLSQVRKSMEQQSAEHVPFEPALNDAVHSGNEIAAKPAAATALASTPQLSQPLPEELPPRANATAAVAPASLKAQTRGAATEPATQVTNAHDAPTTPRSSAAADDRNIDQNGARTDAVSATGNDGRRAALSKADIGSEDPAAALARVRLARTRMQEVSQFFGAPDKHVPPIWNDAQGQSDAERERNQLHERVRWAGSGDFSVDAPVWRMSDSLASLNAGYHVRSGQTWSESGRLSLKMIWREKMWLVTRVELEPAQ